MYYSADPIHIDYVYMYYSSNPMNIYYLEYFLFLWTLYVSFPSHLSRGPTPRQRKRPNIKKNTLIKLNHVSKHYEEGSDNREILTDINAEIKTTEVVSFIGKSGIGKSTLLNLISGIDVCDSGDISIDGVFINKLSDMFIRIIGLVWMSYLSLYSLYEF